eukprot:2272386-Rhodomonas_salina.3
MWQVSTVQSTRRQVAGCPVPGGCHGARLVLAPGSRIRWVSTEHRLGVGGGRSVFSTGHRQADMHVLETELSVLPVGTVAPKHRSVGVAGEVLVPHYRRPVQTHGNQSKE